METIWKQTLPETGKAFQSFHPEGLCLVVASYKQPAIHSYKQGVSHISWVQYLKKDDPLEPQQL